MEVQETLGGRYTLLHELGTGGMAVVWRARDEVLGRPVAVKVLAGRFAGDPQSRARIRDEARAAATLSHPNIAQVYDYGESAGSDAPRPYVVMELINGPTLQQRVAGGPLPPRTVFRICGEVAAALAVAHADGLVHRDIKMANIMVTATGAKVVDFGIAAAVGPASPEEMLVGTPAYLAPERLTGAAIQAASDVYALGVLLYRLLAQQPPWTVETTTQMLNAHIYIEPSPLPALPGVPPEVADLIDRCLRKDPADRPTAAEVSATLGDAAEAALLSVRADPAPPLTVPSPRAVEPGDYDEPTSAPLHRRPPDRRSTVPGRAPAGAAADVPRAAADVPRAAADVPRAAADVPRAAADVPGAAAGFSDAAASFSGVAAGASEAAAWRPAAERASDDADRADQTDRADRTDRAGRTDRADRADREVSTPVGAGIARTAGSPAFVPGAEIGAVRSALPGEDAPARDGRRRAGRHEGQPGAAVVDPEARTSVLPPHRIARPGDGGSWVPEGRVGHGARPVRKKRLLIVVGGFVGLAVAALVWWGLAGRHEPVARKASGAVGELPSAAPSSAARMSPTAGDYGSPAAAVGSVGPGRPVFGASGPGRSRAPSMSPSAPVSDGAPQPSADPSDLAPSGPVGTRLVSPGGAVYAVCSAGKGQLTSWEPDPGYTVQKVNPGPAIAPDIIFKGVANRYRMTVTCVAGTPTPLVLPL